MARGGIRILLAAALAVAALCVPAVASAQVGATLDGSPLNIFADGFGGIQVRQDGAAGGLFYDPEADPGHAGLEIVDGTTYYPLIRDGDGAFNPGRSSAEPITVAPQPDGSQVMHTAYFIGPRLRVSEDITYANGSTSFTIRYGIQNVSGDAVTLRAGAVADLYVGDNDSGNGALSPVAPRFVGGRDASTGLVYGLQELTPWRSFQEGNYTTVFDNFAAGTLDNTVDSGAPDNGVGADFALNLAPGETQNIDVRWLLASPAPPGTYTPPPLGGGGSTPTVVKTGDPKLDALPPPVPGKTVNIGVRKGRIFVKIPPSKKFIELKDPIQIPIGATIDARKGRVNIVSAADKNGSTQLAWFYEGMFTVGQDKGAKPITTLKLAEPLAKCPKKGKASAAAAKKKSRKLWGEGKGTFRTQGNYSSGTIRGTRWLVQDTCAGTLTKVAQGSVLVRDFKAKKNIVVRAGKSYLARR